MSEASLHEADAHVRALLAEVQRQAPLHCALPRRRFIQLAAGTGAGLLLGLSLPARAKAGVAGAQAAFTPAVFLRITTDDRVLIYAPVPEVGQGVKTALPMILAEELEADWQRVAVELAPVDPAFIRQVAGGSRAVPSLFDPLRRAGAAARTLLVAAAAAGWDVPAGECEAREGAVVHARSGRSLRFGALAAAAARLPLPDPATLELKPRARWRLLGSRTGGVDNRALVGGAALFGSDIRLPGMLHAVYERCPAVGGRVRQANLDAVKALPGVRDAFVLEGNGKPTELRAGVAILATSTWAALQARRALRVEWDEREASRDDSGALAAEALRRAAGNGPETLGASGDVDAAFAAGARLLESTYSYEIAAHAPMEPQTCTAHAHAGGIEIWAPSQTPQRARESVAALLGLAVERVTVHQLRGGGGFGRRLINDPVCEAAAIARRAGVPVKLSWTREDDFAHDFFRVGGTHRLKAALDTRGRILAWDNHQVSYSADGRNPVSGGGDHHAPAFRFPRFPASFVPNVRTTRTLLPLATPCGPVRAPWSNTWAFVEQGFLHECAVAAGRDHLEFLLDFYGEPRWLEDGNEYAPHTGRIAAVLRLAAAKAGWGDPLPPGRGRGLAFYFSHAGHFAEVAEVSVDAARRLRVHTVTVAADIGPIINRSGAENQVQGSVLDGLGTLLAQAISVREGRVQERNFDRYPLLRMPQAPQVDVHFIESEHPPTGCGEPALPPLAPAVANAIFAASGIRARRLPLTLDGFSG